MDKDSKGENEEKGSESIPKELRDLLKDIPEEQRGEVTQRLIVTVTVHFSVMRCKKQVIPLCVK